MSTMTNAPQRDHTYLFFRRGLAVVGFGFPIILIIGRWVLESHGILDSISAYYYSVMKIFLLASFVLLALSLSAIVMSVRMTFLAILQVSSRFA